MKVMSKALRPSVVVVVILTLLVGCRLRPIYDVQDRPVPTTEKGLTLEDIEKRIIAAANATEWVTTKVRPGLLRATAAWGGQHVAVVNIAYSLKYYSIKYESSKLLLHEVTDDGRPLIHPNYNKRVWQLETYINEQMRY